MDTIRCDMLIIGGSLGGVAAAERASAMGARVCLVSETDWIGGQLTSQGVCAADENRFIETVGSTASYRRFRRRAREFYRTRFRLSSQGEEQPLDRFNVGNCFVSGFVVEPRVAEQLLSETLAQSRNVALHRNTRAVAAEVAEDSVTAVIAEGADGLRRRFVAPMVLDATDLGDFLPLAGVEHTVGAESQAETGEPHAPDEPHPERIQPLTFPFALERRPAGEDHTIEKPAGFEELKALQNYRLTDGVIQTMFTGKFPMWNYRRVIDAANFDDPAVPTDLSMINTDSIDLKRGVLPGPSAEADAATLALGRQVSLGYVFWLQTECPRDEGGPRRGYPELRPRTDIFETPDGIAPMPYLRESRRIKALVTVVEQDITIPEHAPAESQRGPRARLFRDSCGIGLYGIDIHAGGVGGTPFLGLKTRPFQIPLGALIPRRVRNVLAACKNLGVTHITNGAYRVHPVEWNAGESAGALAAFCVREGVTPRQAHGDPCLLRSYQRELLAAGIPLFWWEDVPDTHRAFAATQRLGVAGIFAGGEDLRFRPEDPLTKREAQTLEQRLERRLPPSTIGMKRADVALMLVRELEGVV